MSIKKTFEMKDKVLPLWTEYEKKYDASFSKMVNNAILEYLNRKLKKKTV